MAALFGKLALTFHFMVNCVLFPAASPRSICAPEKYQQVSNCPKSNCINMLCRVLSHSITQSTLPCFRGKKCDPGGSAAFLFGAAARKSMLCCGSINVFWQRRRQHPQLSSRAFPLFFYKHRLLACEQPLRLPIKAHHIYSTARRGCVRALSVHPLPPFCHIFVTKYTRTDIEQVQRQNKLEK